MMDINDFRHIMKVRTWFADVDMMGHVNNAKYLTYYEEARLQYARDVLGWDSNAQTLGMILVKVVADYLAPLRANQDVSLYTRCSRIGRKSFDLSHLLIRDSDGEMAGTAVITMVAFDYSQEVSWLISDEIRDSILAFEHTPPL